MSRFPVTFAGGPAPALRVLALLVASSATLYWWAIVPVVGADRLLDGDLVALHRGAAAVLELLSWMACLVLLGEAYRSIDGDRARAHKALAFWAAGPILLALTMAAFRDELAGYWSSAASHLSSSRFIGYRTFPSSGEWNPQHVARHEAWLAGWESGRFIAVEVVFWVQPLRSTSFTTGSPSTRWRSRS